MSNEVSNRLVLTRQQLTASLKDLVDSVMNREGRVGWPRLSYTDQYDSFEMRIERSNLGYSVSCRLNGSQSYQLNGVFFNGCDQIGSVMLKASSAPAHATINSFFN